MHKIIRVALCLWLALYGLGVDAQALDVAAGPRLDATGAMQWCATGRDVGLAQVLAGACALQAAQLADLPRGIDGQAFWVRLDLANPGAQALERWLQVGLPRMEEVSLWVPGVAGGWQVHDVGIRTPLDQRGDVARAYGVLPLHLAPATATRVWLRVASRTPINLTTTVWDPAAYRESSGRSQFSLTLALGALLLAMLYSGAIYALTRERAYLYFSLAMAGETFVETFRTGMLQRMAWPTDQPMWLELSTLGTLVTCGSFLLFFHVLLPEIRQLRGLYRMFVAVSMLMIGGLLWSIGIDHSSAVTLWSTMLNIALSLALLMFFQLWRRGLRTAGTLLLSFILPTALELLRLGVVMGWLPFFRVETIAGPWTFVMTTPLLLVSIFQRSREFQDRALKAERDDAAKVEFLTHMSHELRTPLDTILGNAQLLERHNRPALWHEGLANIQKSGWHLLGMIEEVLDHTRGMAGKLTLEKEWLDWPVFLSDMESNARVLCSASGNVFTLVMSGVPLQGVLLDERRMRQVLDNLLANAARHTQNGQIRLTCTATLQAGALVRLDFVLQDSGEGILLADQERIFLPFERGSQNTRIGGKGVGMGLAIARQLVAVMGGQLTLTSAPGAGACFRFWLLAEQGAAQGNLPVNKNRPRYTGYNGPVRTVLVVDDEQTTRAVLSGLLQECGFAVLEAGSGEAAAQVLVGLHVIDLVLTDQFMADGDGWRVLLAGARRWPVVPVMLMSAAAPQRPDDFPQGMVFAAILLKPLDHAELLASIGHVLGLQWIERPEPVMAAAPVECDVVLDAADARDLLEMIEAGRVSDILAWAQALPARVPGSLALASQVDAAAMMLDFSALKALAGVQEFKA